MNWLHYLLEANIYLGVFYVAYCLFLNKETHYLLNRFYLVLSTIVSFILPVLKLGILLPPLPKPSDASYFVAQQVTNVPAPIAVPVQVTAPSFTLQDGLWYVYLTGVVVCTALLIIKLFSLFKLIRANKVTVQDNYKVVYLKDTNTAFSFFNYLFIGTAANNERTILRHELVHIRQKHSADILFLEFLKIINWFNPLVYLLQHSLKTQHEYIADEQTVMDEADATSYSSFLVNNAYGLSGPTITHSFYNLNLLKNRIIMLHQQRSGNLARLKYLVAVPIGAALLCASTLGFSKTYGWIDLAPYNINKQNIEANQQQNDQPKVTDVRLNESFQDKPVKVTDVKLNSSNKKRKTDVVKFPPPIVKQQLQPISERNFKAFAGLREFLAKNIQYPDAAREKKISGVTTVKFNLDDNGNITRSSIDVDGNDFNEAVLAAFNAFTGKISAKDGSYNMYLAFRASKNDQLKFPPPTSSNRTFVGVVYIATEKSLLVDQVKFPPPVVKPVKSAPKRRVSQVKYPKIDVVKFPPPVVKPDKSAPKPKVDQVKFPPPIVKPNPVNSEFLKFLGDHVKYPTEAREKGTRGYVTAEITINDYIITNSRIVKGIGNGCDEEVLRVLNTYKNRMQVKSGTYLLAIAFDLVDPDNEKAYPPLPKIDGVNTSRVVITSYKINK